MIKRICSFVVGLFIMSLGVAFSIVSTLGTTPISSISYSLALITNINIGITTFIFNAALILIQFLILRSRFHKKRLLQLINCILFGYFTDLALYLVSFIPFDGSVLMCIVFLAVSIFLTAFGIFVYMPANIAPLPGEGCVESVAIVTNWRFSTIKISLFFFVFSFRQFFFKILFKFLSKLLFKLLSKLLCKILLSKKNQNLKTKK